jgi:argininosuccinate synthase
MKSDTQTVFIFDGDIDFVVFASGNASKFDGRRHNVNRTLQVIMEDAGHHGIGLVDKL